MNRIETAIQILKDCEERDYVGAGETVRNVLARLKMEVDKPELKGTLKDCYDGKKEVGFTAKCNGEHISFSFDGYGDNVTNDYVNGESCPLLIEIFEGELRVVVWGDINQEDYTHIISLEGAAKSKREEIT